MIGAKTKKDKRTLAAIGFDKKRMQGTLNASDRVEIKKLLRSYFNKEDKYNKQARMLKNHKVIRAKRRRISTKSRSINRK